MSHKQDKYKETYTWTHCSDSVRLRDLQRISLKLFLNLKNENTDGS